MTDEPVIRIPKFNIVDLSRDSILAMEAGRELDALIAERVMKWHREYNCKAFLTAGYYGVYGDDVRRYSINSSNPQGFRWSPSTDITDDYEVLVHVREKWTFLKRREFQLMLIDIARQRISLAPDCPISIKWAIEECWMRYQPGDYSRAALLTTLEAKDSALPAP